MSVRMGICINQTAGKQETIMLENKLQSYIFCQIIFMFLAANVSFLNVC